MTRGRTTNPYLRSGSLLLKRIRWDLKTESYRSRSRLRTKLNRHEGEKAVILCNGPSLLKSDLQALHDSNIATFGLNKINLLYDRTDLRPNFIVAVNPFVIEQNKEFFNQTNAELFLDSYGYTMGCAARSNVCFLHSTNMPGEFARDCSISIFQGFTVTYVAMQLAFHMGFHKLTVIGCDHNFSATGPANTTVKADGKDRNHFDPNYFSDGVSWQLPDLFQSEVAYQIAHQNYMDNGRQLYNSTAGGKLEVLPRIDLAEFIQLA